MSEAILDNEKLGRARIAAYAAGSLGTGVFSTVPTVLLLYFCTETLGITAAIAAVIVFMPKAWSIVWDPFVGAWSDKTRSQWGRRAPFLTVGALGVALSFAMLFSPPNLAPAATVAWVAGAYFLLATTYSLFAVPYVALPAEIASTTAARSRLVAWRMVLGMTGVLVGASFAPLLVEAAGGGRSGYRVMAITVALFCLVAMSAPLLAISRADRFVGRDTRISFAKQIRASLGAPGFGYLAGSYLFQITAIGVVMSSLPYLVTKIFERPEGDIGVAMAALLIGSILTPPLWSAIATQWGAARTLTFAAAAFAITSVGVAAASWLHLPWYGALLVFGSAGFAFAGLQVLPFTMLANLAHSERERSGAAAEATITGMWTATEKLGLACGPAVTAAGLSFYGAAGAPAVVATVPAILLILSVLCLRRLHATDNHQARIAG